MKRRSRIIATFLVAGTVSNVAVAWVCAAWVQAATPRIADPDDFRRVMTRIPPVTPGQTWAPGMVHAFSGVGVYVELHGASSDGVGNTIIVNSVRCGFPMPSFQGSRATHMTAGQWYHEGALLLPGWKTLRGFVPIHPIWSGLVVNTLFHAGVQCLVILGPFVLRGFIRLKRGLCPACAYPIGQSAVCSECGRPLPTGTMSRHE